MGDDYYYNDGDKEIYDVCWEDDFTDKLHFVLRNCFETEKEAEQNKNKVLKTLEKLELQKELQDYADEVNEGWKPNWEKDNEVNKYHIFFHFGENTFKVNYDWIRKGLNEPIFKSRELAEQAIEYFGERLKLLIED